MKAYSKSQSRVFRGVLVAAVAFWFSPPVNAADVYNGKTVYNSYCQGCHGTNGRGEMPGTPNFSRGGALIAVTDPALGTGEGDATALAAYLMEGGLAWVPITHCRHLMR